MTARIVTLALLLGSAGCVLLLHVVRTDLDPIERRLSEYAIGPYSFLMTAAFLTMGAALLALSLQLRPGFATAGSRGTADAPRIARRGTPLVAPLVARLVTPLIAPLVALAGVGLILSAFFRTGTESATVELVHSRASAASVLALTAAAVATALASRSRRAGQPPAPRLTAMERLAALTVVAVAISPILHDTRWSGIGQRFVWLTLATWVVLMAWRAHDRPHTAERPRRSRP